MPQVTQYDELLTLADADIFYAVDDPSGTPASRKVQWGTMRAAIFSAGTLADLSDVTITSIASGEILKWNGSAWVNNTLAEAGIAAASHAHSIENLEEISLSSPASGEILKYNGASWINNTLAEADIPSLSGTNIFTGNTNTYSTEGSTQIIIKAKGASGVQNDSAGMQFQKENDGSNERLIFNRYFGHSSFGSQSRFTNIVGGSTVSALILDNGYVNVGTGHFYVGGKVIDSDRVFHYRSYTVASAPSAATKGAGAAIYVSNGAAGSPCLAFSNGTNWLRCDTLAAISAS